MDDVENTEIDIDEPEVSELELADDDILETDILTDVMPKTQRSGISFLSALMLSLFAAGAGGAIGWLGPKFVETETRDAQKTISALTDDLSLATQQSAKLSQDYSVLAQRLEEAENKIQGQTMLTRRLDALEQQAALVQNQSEADLDVQLAPLTQRLDVLDSLLASGDETQVDSSVLQARLAALEADIEGLRLQVLKTGTSAVLSYSKLQSESNSQLDSQIEVSPPVAVPEVSEVSVYDLKANFPREELLAALSSQTIDAPAQRGFFRRMLERHAEVRDVSETVAVQKINEAQTYIGQGDIDAAIDVLETLSPSLQAVANDWLIQAKKTL